MTAHVLYVRIEHFLFFVVFFPQYKCMILKKEVEGNWESRNKKAGDELLCGLLGSFIFIYFYYATGVSSRRRLFLPCVVSLEQHVIFCHAERMVAWQREWEGNMDRRKSFGSAAARFDTFLWTPVSLHHFNMRRADFETYLCCLVVWNFLNSPHAPCKRVCICSF